MKVYFERNTEIDIIYLQQLHLLKLMHIEFIYYYTNAADTGKSAYNTIHGTLSIHTYNIIYYTT